MLDQNKSLSSNKETTQTVSLLSVLLVQESILNQLAKIFTQNRGISFTDKQLGKKLSIVSDQLVRYFIYEVGRLLEEDLRINLQDGKYIYENNALEPQLNRNNSQKLRKLFELNKGVLLRRQDVQGQLNLKSEKTVDVHISKLKKEWKFQKGETIEGVRGFGHVFGTEEERKTVIDKYEGSLNQTSILKSIFQANKGTVILRSEIASKMNLTTENMVSVLITKMRKIWILDEGDCIESIWGKGYVFGTKEQVEEIMHSELLLKKSRIKPLSKTSKRRIKFLDDNRGKLLTYKDIVNGFKISEDKVAGVISRLRSFLPDGDSIENIRGRGYVYGTPEENNNILEQYGIEKINVERIGAQVQKLKNLFLEKRGKLIKTSDIYGPITQNKRGPSVLVGSLKKKWDFKEGENISNVRGQGYVFGNENERNQILRKYGPKKVTSSREKNIDRFRNYIEENRGKLLVRADIVRNTGIPQSGLYKCVKEIRKELEASEEYRLDTIRGQGFVYGNQQERGKIHTECILKPQKTRKSNKKPVKDQNTITVYKDPEPTIYRSNVRYPTSTLKKNGGTSSGIKRQPIKIEKFGDHDNLSHLRKVLLANPGKLYHKSDLVSQLSLSSDSKLIILIFELRRELQGDMKIEYKNGNCVYGNQKQIDAAIK